MEVQEAAFLGFLWAAKMNCMVRGVATSLNGITRFPGLCSGVCFSCLRLRGRYNRVPPSQLKCSLRSSSFSNDFSRSLLASGWKSRSSTFEFWPKKKPKKNGKSEGCCCFCHLFFSSAVWALMSFICSSLSLILFRWSFPAGMKMLDIMSRLLSHIFWNIFNCLQCYVANYDNLAGCVFLFYCRFVILCSLLLVIKSKERIQRLCPPPAGEPVDTSLCSSAPPPEPVACEVPCSRDCVLSDWTPWSTCSQTCSSKNVEGKQMRTRSILAYNAGEGEMTCLSAATCAQPINFCFSTAWHSPLYFWSLVGV